MDDIIKKFKIVTNDILLDHKQEDLFFFGIAERFEVEEKWDVLLSGAWIKERHDQKDLIYLIEKLKKQFGEDLSFLGQIVILPKDAGFVEELSASLKDKDASGGSILNSVYIRPGFVIRQLCVFANNLSKLNLSLFTLKKDVQTVLSDFS